MTERSLEHKAADGTAVKAGQSWAYRARQNDALAQVTMTTVRLGTQRPARVLVTFDAYRRPSGSANSAG